MQLQGDSESIALPHERLTSQAMSAWQGPPEGWACSGSGAMRSNNLSPLAALYVTPKSLPLVRVEGHNISQSCSGDK